ncbi:glycosyltransferase family 2 protein [Xylanibacter ruminicola]|uniref:Glycosyltransferase involved in cell wall bisynthesis n=1 Tax=Xylanibacter ruminicola TaxID=839 RepID=A0A1M6R7E6_XYLRU|nr:glycosyltransferase family 2 protein [Xylanibacter ruminicola]SHK28405.1 Glycosyltransferase involved in cell wall bisynthesis [Xylanibacter ruminicola]
MINNKTDWFGYVDNFKKIEHIDTLCIFENRIKDALVTIGIPTFKRSKTIIDTIESAIKQECHFPYEIIILDNNPERNDETENVVSQYINTHNISYYKNEENVGMAGNWNRLFTLSQAKWVTLLHDDDMISPSFLEDMVSVANDFNADVVNSGFLFWNEKKECKPEFKHYKNDKIFKSTLSLNFYGHQAGMPTGIIYKREMFIAEGGFNQDFFPSLDYVCHAKLSYKHNFFLYSKKLTLYRFSQNESSKITTKEKYIALNYAFQSFIGKMLNYPKWYVNLYIRLVAGYGIKKIDKDFLYIDNKKISKVNYIGKLLRFLIPKLALLYIYRKNLVTRYK